MNQATVQRRQVWAVDNAAEMRTPPVLFPDREVSSLVAQAQIFSKYLTLVGQKNLVFTTPLPRAPC